MNATQYTFSSSGKSRYEGDILRYLIEKKWIRYLGPGIAAYSGDIVGLINHFTGIFRDMAMRVGAREIIVPDYMVAGTIRDSGYLHSFPQHALLVSSVKRNKSSEKVDLEEGDGTGLARIPTVRRYMLTPTVCFNMFEYLRGARIEDGESLVLTSIKRCFRNEDEAIDEFGRFSNFTMLEIVFFGSQNSVMEMRNRLLSESADVVKQCDLAGGVKRGEDPFFRSGFDGDEDSRRSLFQKRLGVKYELRLEIPSHGCELAVASYNLHFERFARAFDIHYRGGKPLWSGCVGFGLERWALSFLAQHGPDRETWPITLAKSNHGA